VGALVDPAPVLLHDPNPNPNPPKPTPPPPPTHQLIIDTGDALWRSHSLKLPPNSSYEVQVLAGNIGPGLPCGLGFSLGAAHKTGNRTVIFQV